MGRELLLQGRIVSGSMDIADGLLAVDDGYVSYAGPLSGYRGSAPLPHPSERHLLLPGLVDVHCHGASGADFSAGSTTAGRSAARYLHRQGTTTLLASLVTAAPAELLHNVKAMRVLAEEGLIAGSHLEGPFLAPGQCGAHNPALLLAPDAALLAALLEAAGPSLASMTVAAELAGAAGLVDLLTAHGVLPSLGHTAADHRTAAAFLDRAATGMAGNQSRNHAGYFQRGQRPTVTHLFNAMPSLHHRSPGPVAACLAAARAGKAVVELVADGIHLDPGTVKLVFDLVGAENIALITDSMAATGLGDGTYRLGSQAVVVADGTARTEGTEAIAGGTATLLDVVRSTVAAGVPLQDAVASASAVPAAVLGLSEQAGDLRAGMPADVVLVDPDLNLEGVLRRGQWVRAPSDRHLMDRQLMDP